MASGSPRKRFWEETTCPICLECFVEPMTPACVHNFCRNCIMQSLDKSPTSTLCPLCKRSFCPEDLKPNYNVGGFSYISRLLSNLEEVDCERHHDPLKLFCNSCATLLCTSCTKEHQDHDIVPAEEVAKEFKDWLSSSVKSWEKLKDEMMENYLSTRDKGTLALKQIARERQNMAVRFQDLWLFLKRQEDLTLTQMKQTEKQMERKRDQRMDRLYQRLASLEGLIQEVEKKKEMPANQLLKNAGSLLKRSRKLVKLNNPSGFLPVLRRKVLTITNTSAILERAMKEFEDSVSSATSSRKLK
ncbi:zinc finger protein RFP-like [Heteronotia binoei]|uniref:zinc finger protein RFP-like n=1 Tax=Heteronotia binoei TaxID=13085 RepID=UPI00292E2C2C|nr:zinc finger protein RFP-like [Heteronotia binoei]